MSHKISGGCCCGEVTFAVEDHFKHFYFCHCEQCRKMTGSAHASNLFTAPDNIRWLTGESMTQRYDHPQRAYRVYASSLGRAIQTAHIICDEIGFEKANVHQDDRLKEFSLGTWEEKPLFELLDEDPALLDRRDWYLKAPKAETYQDVQTRLNDWLAEIPEQEDIVVVSHGLTGIVLRGMLLGLNYDQVWAQDLPQDAFFIIQNGIIERVNCFQDKSFI